MSLWSPISRVEVARAGWLFAALMVLEMHRVLKPGGRLLILDFSLPAGILRAPYRLYLHHVLPRMAGLLTGQRDAYEYLGGSIEAFPSGKAMCGLLETCGFTATNATPLTGGVVSIYEGTRPKP